MMIGDRIRELNSRDPFLPFELRHASGSVVRVALPGQLWAPPGSRWIEVAGSRRLDDDADAIRIDLASVVEVLDVGERRECEGPMTIEKFDEFLKRRPFDPFTITTADGAEFPVIGPEFAARTQGGRTIFVSTGGEQTEWIDLLLVSRLRTGVPNPTGKKESDAA